MPSEYCECKNSTNVFTKINDKGTFDICDDCNKEIEGSFKYFNQHDGKKHDFYDEY
ncbi:hypothetical protein [Carnobacterium inhibens]|uniref:hypothetical protein n=1 Tax=Carnobacterium inhibens TaxID=147709 RepID=UPI00147029A1|nr:hypothetical protein [Carnobacterium inhibens]